MTPQTQAFIHDPAAGVRGDCYRTAIACLLDVPRDDVPHVEDDWTDGKSTRLVVNAFLAKRGLVISELPVALHGGAPDVAIWMGIINPGVPYLLSGTTPRGWDHIVVVHDDVIWDPHPSRSGLTGPCDDGFWWVGVLAFRGALEAAMAARA